MIRVPKPQQRIPADWATIAAGERAKNESAFRKARSKRAKAKLKFAFKAYGNRTLRIVLNDIYSFKCAYCESLNGANHPVPIDHFRPKSEIVDSGEKIRPAYFWLAGEWMNLYPSCTDCNSQRKHEYPEGPKLRGKGNEFPLQDPAVRATRPGEEAREKPLILDPGLDDPKVHLEFLTDEKDRGVIRAALVNGVESRKGTESIRVYALDRPILTRTRRDYAKIIVHQCKKTSEAADELRAAPNNARAQHKYREDLDMLRWHLEKERPFLQMTRQLVAAYFPGFVG